MKIDDIIYKVLKIVDDSFENDKLIMDEDLELNLETLEISNKKYHIILNDLANEGYLSMVDKNLEHLNRFSYSHLTIKGYKFLEKYEEK